MSEPMSSVEIEDVLSSIRRLVSEDLRPVLRKTADVQAVAPDKLILTPALRVVDDAVEAPAEPVAEEIHAVPAPPVDEILLSKGAADADPYWASEPVEEWPATANDNSENNLQALLDDIASSKAESVADLEYDASAVIVQDAAEHENLTIESVVSALGAAVTDQGWSGEPDEPAGASDWSQSGWSRSREDEGSTHAVGAVEEAEVVLSNTGQEARMAAAWADNEPWVDEPVKAAPDRHFPPMADTASDDQAEAAAVAEIVGAAIEDEVVSATAAAAEIRMFDEDDSVLDEEVLRELVREIIREELQGTLGERITRNVRKLVRIEINRALITRDFN